MAQSDIESLLVHEPFVRAVARALLRGDDRVDDVVQETWVAALNGKPREPGTARSWLGGIARNVARTVLRRDQSRRRREHQVQPPRGVPSPEEIQAREEVRRRVLAELVALDEPYRSALLLRFYEDLPPREIAKHLDVPVETARTRVRRGLERLRARLDEKHGGKRRAWAMALLPLLLRREPALAATAAAGGATLIGGWLGLRALGAAAVVAALVVVGVVSFTAAPIDEMDEAPVEPTPEDVALAARREADEATRPADAIDRIEITGRLVGPGGVPVAGASVVAWSRPTDLYSGWSPLARMFENIDPPRVALAEARSDGEGHFSLAPPRGRPVSLEATAPGLVSHALRGIDTSRETRGIVLTMHAEVTLEGVVVDVVGRPLAGARVRTRPSWNAWREMARREAHTDEHGRFELQGLLVGAVSLLVEHHGHAPRYLQNVRTGSKDVCILLEAGLPVEGTVLTRPDDQPVTDALVTIVPANASYPPVTAPTDGRGRFRMEHVGTETPFRFVLSVRSPSHGMAIESEVVWCEDDPLVVHMDEGRVLRGRVVIRGEDGEVEPAPGARLLVYTRASWNSDIWYGGDKNVRPVAADAEGRFELAGVSAGKGSIHVDSRDHAYHGASVEFDGETGEIVVPVVRKRAVGGLVLAPDGSPAAGAEIRLGSETRFQTGLAPGAIHTDAEGRFLLAAVPPSEPKRPVWVHARLPGVGVARALAEADLELRLVPQRIVTGVVLDAEEEPVAGVLVKPSGPWSTPVSTDARGRYRVEVPAEGEGRLTFRRDGFRHAESSGGGVVIQRAISVTGVVVDRAGEPLPRAFVRVTGDAVGPPGLVWRLADEVGRFRLTGLGPGAVYLSAWAEGHTSPVSIPLTLPHADDVRIEFEPARTITGVVLDRAGGGIARVRVEAYRTDGRKGPGTRTFGFTDVRGRFTLEGLGAGPFRVAAYGEAVFDDVPAVSAGDTGVTIRAAEAVRVEGVVVMPPGVSRKGIRVFAYREDREIPPQSERPWEAGRPRRARTDEEGRFLFDRLVGKRFSVWAHHPELAGPTLRAVPAGAAGLRLVFEAGGMVSGRVTGAVEATVFLEAADGRGATRSITIDEAGRFEATGLAADTVFRLRAWTKDRSREVTIDGVTAGRADLVVDLERRD